jgi:hypothetical protein
MLASITNNTNLVTPNQKRAMFRTPGKKVLAEINPNNTVLRGKGKDTIGKPNLKQKELGTVLKERVDNKSATKTGTQASHKVYKPKATVTKPLATKSTFTKLPQTVKPTSVKPKVKVYVDVEEAEPQPVEEEQDVEVEYMPPSTYNLRTLI